MPDDKPTGGYKTRSGNGRFTRNADGAEHDATAARMHADGHTYAEIAEHLGVTRHNAMRAVQRAVRDVVRGPAEEVLALHANRLESIFTRAEEIMETDHPRVSATGKVVVDNDGTPVVDPGPVLAAMREMRGALADFRKMFGLEAPQKVDVGNAVSLSELLAAARNDADNS